MIERLQRIYHKEQGDFVAACYRELLGRAPDGEGLQMHTMLLNRGTSKLHLMVSLLISPEAVQLYRPSHAKRRSDRKYHSCSELLLSFIDRPDTQYVEHLYEELLARKVDPTGMRTYMEELKKGTPRAVVVAQLVQSTETQKMMMAKNSIPIAQKLLLEFAERKFMPPK
jgi:hypothetical protein